VIERSKVYYKHFGLHVYVNVKKWNIFVILFVSRRREASLARYVLVLWFESSISLSCHNSSGLCI